MRDGDDIGRRTESPLVRFIRARGGGRDEHGWVGFVLNFLYFYQISNKVNYTLGPYD